MSAPRGPARQRGGGRGTGRLDKTLATIPNGTLRRSRADLSGRPRSSSTNTRFASNPKGPPVRGGKARDIVAQRAIRPPRAQRPSTQSWRGIENAGTADWKTRMEELWQSLKKDREQERKAAIQGGFLSDPDKPTSLANAITPVGTCQDMCPEFERVERIHQMMVDGCEKTMGLSGDKVACEDFMVKRFRRSAAGYDEQLPSDIRPPLVLQTTLNYLLDEIVGGPESLASTHKFVWDRTRGIRNDFSIQQVTKVEDIRIAIECFEKIARFHILSLHQLSHPDRDNAEFDHFQEREQLNNTLLSLMYYYDDSRHKLASPNEAEFRAYCIILEIQDQRPDLEDRAQNWPKSLLQDPRVSTAMKLYAAAGNTSDEMGPLRPRTTYSIAQGNYTRFWLVIGSTAVSYLMACCAEIYFHHVRGLALEALWKAYRRPGSTRLEDLVLGDVTDALAFDDEEQTRQYCEEHGLSVGEREDGIAFLDVNSVPTGQWLTDSNPRRKQLFSKTLVEPKRHSRTLPAVINGFSVSRCQADGLIRDQSEAGSVASQNEEEESLFIPPGPAAKTSGVATAPVKIVAFGTPSPPAFNPFAPNKHFDNPLPRSSQSFLPTLAPTQPALQNSFAPRPSTPSGQPASLANPFAGTRPVPAAGTNLKPPPLSNNQIAESIFKTPSFSLFPPSDKGAFNVSPTQATTAVTTVTSSSVFKVPAPPVLGGNSTSFPPSQSALTQDAKGARSSVPIPRTTSAPLTPSLFGIPPLGEKTESNTTTNKPFFDFQKRLEQTPEKIQTTDLASGASASHFAPAETTSSSLVSTSSTAGFPSLASNPAASAPARVGFPITSVSVNQTTAAALQGSPKFSAPFQFLTSPSSAPSQTITSTSAPHQASQVVASIPPFQSDSTPFSIATSLATTAVTPTLTQVKPSPPESVPWSRAKSLDNLAKTVAMEEDGILDQFFENELDHIVRQAMRTVEEEYEQARAVAARVTLLSIKYLRRWKDIAWTRALRRKSKDRRKNFAQSLQAMALGSRSTSRASSLSPAFEPFTSLVGMRDGQTMPPRAKAVSGQSKMRNPSASLSREAQTSAEPSTAVAASPAKRPRLFGRNRSSTLAESMLARSGKVAKAGQSFRLSNALTQDNRLLTESLMREAARLSTGRRTDTTRTDYFRLKALGVDPDTPTIPTTRKRRSTDEVEVEVRKAARSSSEKVAPRIQVNGDAPSAQQGQPPVRNANAAVNAVVNAAVTPTAGNLAAKADDNDDEVLFAQVRAVRVAMSESESWFREYREESERCSRSSSGVGAAASGQQQWRRPETEKERHLRGMREAGPSPSRTELRLRGTSEHGLLSRGWMKETVQGNGAGIEREGQMQMQTQTHRKQQQGFAALRGTPTGPAPGLGRTKETTTLSAWASASQGASADDAIEL